MLAREGGGWMEQLPSIQREEVKIPPLSAVQLINFSAEVGQIQIPPTNSTRISMHHAVSLRHVPIPTFKGM
jgi:hypothetical protein